MESYSKMLIAAGILAVLVLFAAAFLIGRTTAPRPDCDAQAYAQAAAFLQGGPDAPTFCDLSERARMYACPALRKVMSLSQDSYIIGYKCASGSLGGYADMVGVGPEDKIDLLSRLRVAGVSMTRVCSKGESEVYRISRGGSRGEQSI
jgi:hypothetical protein